jgi:uncharacterized protein
MLPPNRRVEETPLPHTRIFVVKVASRCNLACSYCYMYQHPDQSWRDQPHFMSQTTVNTVARRLQEHAENLPAISSMLVVAHGGEPLLYPHLDYFFQEIKRSVTSCNIAFAIQTNGTLFDNANLGILRRHGVHIGVSVDGSREVHNRKRITHDGSGSYDNVISGLNLARSLVPDLLDSVLQVIDPSVTPKGMLDTLESYGVPRADLLFPDLNHDTIVHSDIRPGQLGEWLSQVFDDWARRRDTVHIRIFLTILNLLLGSQQGTDQLGAQSDGVLMIETDGSYHVYDAMKTAYPGAGCTGVDVENAPVQIAESDALARAYREKAIGASETCLRCRLFAVCGGGNPIHRFSRKNGFENPSVYCDDLTILIDHIRQYAKGVRPGISLVC